MSKEEITVMVGLLTMNAICCVWSLNEGGFATAGLNALVAAGLFFQVRLYAERGAK